MHTVKGGWVGQTFALAKGNESSGRKSRIRRSKEERKEMVESFIKTYQMANNGSFPSLNLTHKEVGGSFYTVREIVREIIQENRVLGPGKLTSEELHPDQLFLEKYPLGSISLEPDIVLPIQPNGSDVVSNHCEELDESLPLSNGLSAGSEHQKFDDKVIINGSPVIVENETDKAKAVAIEVEVSERLEEQRSGKELEASSTVNHISTDVVVETFPLRPVPKLTDSKDGISGEAIKSNKNLKQMEIGKLDYIVENGGDLLDDLDSSNNSSLAAERGEAKMVDLLLKEYGLVDNKVENLSEPPQESSDHLVESTTIGHQTNNSAPLGVVMSHQDVLTSQAEKFSPAITGEQVVSSLEGIDQKPHDTGMSSGKLVNRKEEKGGNQTLDVTNLESQEGASKSAAPAQAETNPLWTVFKSFIASFVKFWSE